MFSRSYVCSNRILTDTFIDNDEGLEHESDSRAYVPLRDYEDNTHNIDNIVRGIYDRARSYRATPRVFAYTDGHDEHMLARMPAAQDFPIWRVACRVSFYH